MPRRRSKPTRRAADDSPPGTTRKPDMKITVWLRREEGTRKRTLRTDFKYESFDDPALQNFGRALIKAIENGGQEDGEQEGKK